VCRKNNQQYYAAIILYNEAISCLAHVGDINYYIHPYNVIMQGYIKQSKYDQHTLLSEFVHRAGKLFRVQSDAILYPMLATVLTCE